MQYLTMIFEFFKIGLFSIGGGLATLPFLYELAEKYPWFSTSELTNMIAVSESTPGPIGVNMATYVGVTSSGIFGGILTALSLVAPSLIIILIIARILEKFRDSLLVKDLFYGLRAAVAGVIAAAVLNVITQSLFDLNAQNLLDMFDFRKLILFALLIFAVFKFKKHPIFYIAVGAILGVVFKF